MGIELAIPVACKLTRNTSEIPRTHSTEIFQLELHEIYLQQILSETVTLEEIYSDF